MYKYSIKKERYYYYTSQAFFILVSIHTIFSNYLLFILKHKTYFCLNKTYFLNQV